MGMYSNNGEGDPPNGDDNGFQGCAKGLAILILGFLFFCLIVAAIVSQWN